MSDWLFAMHQSQNGKFDPNFTYKSSKLHPTFHFSTGAKKKTMALAELGQLTLLDFFQPISRHSKRLVPPKRRTRLVSTQFTLLDYYTRVTEEPPIPPLTESDRKEVSGWVKRVDRKELRFSPIILEVKKYPKT